MPAKVYCRECACWDRWDKEDTDAHVGDCHRRSPQVVPNVYTAFGESATDDSTAWPTTKNTDYCWDGIKEA